MRGEGRGDTAEDGRREGSGEGMGGGEATNRSEPFRFLPNPSNWTGRFDGFSEDKRWDGGTQVGEWWGSDGGVMGEWVGLWEWVRNTRNRREDPLVVKML